MQKFKQFNIFSWLIPKLTITSQCQSNPGSFPYYGNWPTPSDKLKRLTIELTTKNVANLGNSSSLLSTLYPN